jgi:hypothetical protein
LSSVDIGVIEYDNPLIVNEICRVSNPVLGFTASVVTDAVASYMNLSVKCEEQPPNLSVDTLTSLV